MSQTSFIQNNNGGVVDIANPTVIPTLGAITGTGSAQTVYTQVITANTLSTNNGVYFKALVYVPTRNDDFTLEVKYGGVLVGEVSVIVGTSSASYETQVWIEGHLFNNNSTGQQICYVKAIGSERATSSEAGILVNQSGTVSDTLAATGRLTSSVDSTVNQDLDFDIILGSGDQIDIDFLQVFVG